MSFLKDSNVRSITFVGLVGEFCFPDSTMVNHHFAPLFGGICFFPTTLSFREWDTATSKLDGKFRVLKGSNTNQYVGTVPFFVNYCNSLEI